MRKENFYLVFFVFLLMSAGFVSADVSYYEEDNTALGSIGSTAFYLTKLRYESYPVSPGDYFTIWIQIEKNSGVEKDVTFELIEEYPFFLDSNEEAVRAFSNVGAEAIVLEYKVRVDESAVSGVNTLKFRQTSELGSSIIHEFDISIEEVQTAFDAVVQDNVDGEVSIALANIGQNDANAAIVKIPEQDGIRIVGTSGQMIGNLEQGDYTVVGFVLSGTASVLEMQIDYTDSIGIRRSELIEIPFDASFVSSSGALEGTVARGGLSKNGSSQVESTSYVTWIVWIFVIAVLVFVGYKYVKKKKNSKGISSLTPEWMKKEKGAKK